MARCSWESGRGEKGDVGGGRKKEREKGRGRKRGGEEKGREEGRRKEERRRRERRRGRGQERKKGVEEERREEGRRKEERREGGKKRGGKEEGREEGRRKEEQVGREGDKRRRKLVITNVQCDHTFCWCISNTSAVFCVLSALREAMVSFLACNALSSRQTFLVSSLTLSAHTTHPHSHPHSPSGVAASESDLSGCTTAVVGVNGSERSLTSLNTGLVG